uniref:DUF4136 domain-containing protein n=1 Tax=Plectus sambesii TaxID=2011161 RepID=A0A914WFV6_9BILA
MAYFTWARKKRVLYVLLLQISLVNSCAPGIGPILGAGPLIRNPRFAFDVTPASLWTYSSQQIYGIDQSANANAAQSALNNDVRNAILTALAAWRITDSFTVDAKFTDSPQISGPTTPATPCGAAVPPVPGGCSLAGTMISSFTTTPPGAAYILTMNVNVQTETRLTQAQWILIGNQILTNLAVSSKALPRSMITTVTGDGL